MRAVMIVTLVALGLGASACRPGQPVSDRGASLAPAASASGTATALSGAVTMDGSSTVLPLSKAMAAAFQKANGSVQVTAVASGTTAGFKRFCGGEIDIASASRPINAEEERACGSRKIEYIELPVGFDSLSVVVNARNSFVTQQVAGRPRDRRRVRGLQGVEVGRACRARYGIRSMHRQCRAAAHAMDRPRTRGRDHEHASSVEPPKPRLTARLSPTSSASVSHARIDELP
jgi:hypothetical protein